MTTPFTAEQIGKLASPIKEGRISQRSGGGGSKLSYLEAWDVKATLIRIFGFGNFSVEVIDAKIIQIDKEPAANAGDKDKYTVLAQATARLTIHATGAVYTETAAASQTGKQGIGEVADFALKTAESDAVKRAATYLGTQFGLSLYNNGMLNDVVQVVLESEQKALLEEARGTAPAEAREAVQGALKSHSEPVEEAP